MQDSPAPDKNTSNSSSGSKSRDPMIGTTLDDRYYIEGILGTGGMSVVYKAVQLTIDRHVAVKTIKLQVDTKPVYRERFLREIRSLCALSHPNVVTVYDCVIGEDDQPYVVMDYLRGKSLDNLIVDEGPLDLERFARICVQVCSALDHAHKKGIVHRDVKPGNIVLMDEEMDFVKVVDFGLAKLGDDGRKLTNSGELWGSPPYISPEQCMGKTGDARSDIYSFGAVMYEMLTGKDPFFEAISVFELIQKHVGSNPPPFVDVNHKLAIPSKVQDMVFKAMEKDPERRYQTALALQQGIIEACTPDIGRESREYLVHMAKQASTRTPSSGQQSEYFHNAADLSVSDMNYLAQGQAQADAQAAATMPELPKETAKWSRAAADNFVPSLQDPEKNDSGENRNVSISELDAIKAPQMQATPVPPPPIVSPTNQLSDAPPPITSLSRQAGAPGQETNYIIIGVVVLALIGFLIFQQISARQKTTELPTKNQTETKVSDTETTTEPKTETKTDSVSNSDSSKPKTLSPAPVPKPYRQPARPRRVESTRVAPAPKAVAPKTVPKGKQDPWSTLEQMRE
ncbi:MAG: serine/threonine protein kinase [Cyanobacteria bacterium TGS_CYA1]|nr:serine/threonine protein kinase [Cyanobacteria bacterium TGS_CYA1]